MIVVYCLDENYAKWTDLSIRSVRKYNQTAKIVLVSEKPMRMWRDDIENFVIPLDRTFRNRGDGDRITNAAYLKCFLTRLPYEKVIYLDGDTICQSPLNLLWEMKCDYINICESHNYGKEQAKALKIDKYGMTGMMVMNLDALRKIGFTETCLEVEKDYPTPATGWQHDETCINVAMNGLLHFIDKTWLYCRNRKYDMPMRDEQAKILHFVGGQKDEMGNLPDWKNISEIKSAIKGKNVAIVGNAKSIFDTQYGPAIDKADFIIRFNRGFITKPESQGTRTNFLILACELTNEEIESYNATYAANRSKSYLNPVYFTLSQADRAALRSKLDVQPSTGFMAIDICLSAGAKSINLYGFDFERTPTFYNPEGYKTEHNYRLEELIVSEYERCGLLTINKPLEKQNDR